MRRADRVKQQDSTAVLVVGGSVVGLSAAIFLAWRGVPVVLVERHRGSSPHPRALGFTTRTMELYRAVGLESHIPQVPRGMGRPRRIVVESLAGQWHEETTWTPKPPPGTADRQSPATQIEYSPCTGAALAQDRLEPILRARAIELGADVRLSTELVAFEQDAAGVAASLRERDGREYGLRADYLIAADGHASSVREALGIGRDGRGHIRTIRSILFRAPLDQYLDAGISQFQIEQPDLNAMLVTYRDGRWALMFQDDEERDENTLRAMVYKDGADLAVVQMDVAPASDDPAAIRTAFGIGPEGASLIRPDGYVAWRSIDLPADPSRAVTEALKRAASATQPADASGAATSYS
jgi:putative polyketide hydroxylase